MTKTLRGPNGITLTLDATQIFPNDPGQGTPAMVYTRGGSATYWCASDTGTVMDDNWIDDELSVAQIKWLHEQAGVVADFIADNS